MIKIILGLLVFSTVPAFSNDLNVILTIDSLPLTDDYSQMKPVLGAGMAIQIRPGEFPIPFVATGSGLAPNPSAKMGGDLKQINLIGPVPGNTVRARIGQLKTVIEPGALPLFMRENISQGKSSAGENSKESDQNGNRR